MPRPYRIPNTVPDTRDTGALTVAPITTEACYFYVHTHKYGNKYFFVGWKGDPEAGDFGAENNSSGLEIRVSTSPSLGDSTVIEYHEGYDQDFISIVVGSYLYIFTEIRTDAGGIMIYNLDSETRVYRTIITSPTNFHYLPCKEAICYRTRTVGNTEYICFYLGGLEYRTTYTYGTQYPALFTYYVIHTIGTDLFVTDYCGNVDEVYPYYKMGDVYGYEIEFNYQNQFSPPATFIQYSLRVCGMEIVGNLLYYFFQSSYIAEIAYPAYEARHVMSLAFAINLPDSYTDEITPSGASQIDLSLRMWNEESGWDTGYDYIVAKTYPSDGLAYLFERTYDGFQFRVSTINGIVQTIHYATGFTNFYYLLEDDAPVSGKSSLSVIYWPGSIINCTEFSQVGIHSFNTSGFTLYQIGGTYDLDMDLYCAYGSNWLYYSPLIKIQFLDGVLTSEIVYNGYNLLYDWPDIVKPTTFYPAGSVLAEIGDPDVIFNSDPPTITFMSPQVLLPLGEGDPLPTWVTFATGISTPSKNVMVSDTLVMSDRVSVLLSVYDTRRRLLGGSYVEFPVSSPYCAAWKTVDNSSPLEITIDEVWYVREV